MKKILYTVSAIVLGLTASRAQAETGTKIAPYQVVHPQVDFVSTFGLEKGSELRFGVVVNPQVGQTITITPNNQISSSYSGNATENATLLGVGMIDSEKAINVSTVSRGSVTVSGHIGTLNKAGTVKLLFPTEAVTLSDGGTTCGSVVINPALDGENGVVTGRQSEENPGLYYYGGTLTLSTNATGKHCVGSGQVTLVFDESAVFDPDDFSNDPVDNFSLIPAGLPEFVGDATFGTQEYKLAEGENEFHLLNGTDWGYTETYKLYKGNEKVGSVYEGSGPESGYILFETNGGSIARDMWLDIIAREQIFGIQTNANNFIEYSDWVSNGGYLPGYTILSANASIDTDPTSGGAGNLTHSVASGLYTLAKVNGKFDYEIPVNQWVPWNTLINYIIENQGNL